ncbi:hypothetical protein E4T38_02476 [Aureobasidium subglaciale]|nr:hypothetical protein E4T38_02476 [Aureobasidium subglaciale]KAI5228149.1 hypothetical protein E4T40_02255 [Aureobasidium subglaciale]KAI5231379.1 hypothetical protein E4T41_02475 [Aureobasidium subglaciale]KAI5265553.1 hypothetical protein E4T46_02253 [Aureobasidium subglaciale]
MLPDFLQDSYSTYKRDTDLIANWLATTAQRCGYNPETLGGSPHEISLSQLKGRARKLARDVHKPENKVQRDEDVPVYIISIKSFITLASQIVGCTKPFIRVPKILSRVLDRAIDFRKKHNKWFRHIGVDDDSTENDTHAHFISVLERVRSILEPNTTRESDQLQPKRQNHGGEPQKMNKVHTTNSYEGLSVEVLSEEFLNAPLLNLLEENAVEIDAVAQYRAERMSKGKDKVMATCVLIYTTNTVRRHVQSLWLLYRDKRIVDLQAAAIVTDTAVEMVRRLQEDHERNFPDATGDTGHLECVLSYYHLRCKDIGEDILKRERPGDTINFAVYDIAHDCFIDTFMMLRELSDFRTVGVTSHFTHTTVEDRDTSTQWHEKSPREKFLDNTILLTRAITGLTGLVLLDGLSDDELVRGIREMGPGKPIHLWLVFAAPIFLDVQHWLGPDVERPFQEMQKGGRYIKASLDQTVTFHTKLPLDAQVKNQNIDKLQRLSKAVDVWLLQDTIDILVNGHLDPEKRHDAYDFLKQNPVLCGIWLFSARYAMQDTSLHFVRHWGTIIFGAHLHMALRVQGIALPWEDMDVFMKLQDGARFFTGVYPKTLEDCSKRFDVCHGQSITTSAKNRRRAVNSINKGNLEIPMASLLAGRYMHHHNSSLSTDFAAVENRIREIHIKDVVSGQFSLLCDSETSKLARIQFSRAQKNSTEKLDTTDLLNGLANSLRNEVVHLSFDYLRLHRICCNMISSVKEEVGPDLRNMLFYGEELIGRGDHLHIPSFVGCILMHSMHAEQYRQKKDRNTNKYSCGILIRTAQCVKEAIKGKSGSIVIDIIKGYFGYQWELAGE